MDDQPTKICRACGGEFTYDKLKKDKRKTGGVDAMCKECHNVSTRAYKRERRSDPELRALDNERAVAGQKYKYHNNEEYRIAILEAEHQRYVTNTSVRERKKENSRRWRANMTEEQRAKSLKDKRRWDQDNPQCGIIKAAKRRTAKNSLPFDFVSADANFALEFFGYLCAYCNCQLDTSFKSTLSSRLFWEHIVPIIPNYELTNANPGTVPINMIPCCQHCNDSKGSNEQHAWLVKTFGQQRASDIENKVNEYKANARVSNN